MRSNPDQEYRRNIRRYYRKKRWQSFKKGILRLFRFNNRKRAQKSSRPIKPTDIARRELQLARNTKRRNFLVALQTLLTNTGIRKQFIRLSLLSLSMSIVGFLFIYSTYIVVTIIIARFYAIPIEWVKFQFSYPLPSGAPQYTKNALITIFLSGPIFSLTIAWISWKLFFGYKPKQLYLRFLLLWTTVYGINGFFGSLITGIITRTDTIYATLWLFMNSMFDMSELFIVLFSIAVMLLIGRALLPMILVSSLHNSFLLPGSRMIVLLINVILPQIFAVALIIGISLPYFPLPFILKPIFAGIIMVPSMFRYNSFPVEILRNYKFISIGK